MSHYRMLAKLHLIALFLWIVLKYQPEKRLSSVQLLTQQCQYDTKVLCPECFPTPVNCSFFESLVTIDGNELLEGILQRFDQHGVRYGTLRGSEQQIVIKNLNREGAVEELRDLICEELGVVGAESCQLMNEDPFLGALQRRVLDENLLEGAILCPPLDEEALERFLFKIDDSNLSRILQMKVNAQPLLLKLLHQHDFPVPKFIFQGGFTLVESYEGETLANYYDSSLTIRLMIANELIKASMNFTTGVDGFRFYLTDLSPDNVVVRKLPDNGIKVSFVDLNNVIILDSHSTRLNPHKVKHTHSRIECDGCFAYVQEDLCSHQYSDINLYAVCQLLLENLNGDSNRGFLHNDGADTNLGTIRTLLHNCVYCQPPYCEDRQNVLQRIQGIIRDIVY